MKTRFITSFIFCFSLVINPLSTSAQEYTYDISKYYTPDIVRNQLDVSFNTNNSFNQSKFKTDTTRSTFSTTMNGLLTPDFQRYTNTRKRLTLFEVSGQFTGNYSSNGLVTESYPYKAFQTDDNLTLNYSNHFYNSKNQFLALGISSNLQASLNNYSDEASSTKAYNHEYSLNVAPSVGVGIGRIESVEDARQAIYILDDLSKKGVLTRPLNDEEVFQFAQQISRVKNKRFLDARLHMIDEITSVDSFLVRNNLLNKSDARYFTTLYDNWQYGALYPRKSGQTFEITFTPSYNWNYIKNNPTDSTYRGQLNQNNLVGGLSLTYTYEKPVNLNWQHSVSASINGYTNFSNYLYESGSPYYPYGTSNYGSLNGHDSRSVNFSGNYSLGFYPSTRTYLRARVIENLQMLYTKELNVSSTGWDKTFTSFTGISFDAYYYLSPQVRLSVGANFGNSYTNYYSSNYNQWYGGFGGTLSYSLF